MQKIPKHAAHSGSRTRVHGEQHAASITISPADTKQCSAMRMASSSHRYQSIHPKAIHPIKNHEAGATVDQDHQLPIEPKMLLTGVAATSMQLPEIAQTAHTVAHKQAATQQCKTLEPPNSCRRKLNMMLMPQVLPTHKDSKAP
jgi:hypothetical protein